MTEYQLNRSEIYLILNALKQMDNSTFTEYGTKIWCNLIEMSSFLLHRTEQGQVSLSAVSSNIWDNLVEMSKRAQES